MQFCNTPGCGVLVSSGRCPAHSRAERPRYAGHAWYSLARWKRLRLDVLRAQPFCVRCLEQGRKVLTTDIDHVRKHDGDPALFWDPANLQGLCRGCHTIKTTRGE